MAAVPARLENAVGEAHSAHDVLDRLLARGNGRCDRSAVRPSTARSRSFQRLGRSQVRFAERLFRPPPGANGTPLLLAHQPGGRPDASTISARRALAGDGQIENRAAVIAVQLCDLGKLALRQPRIGIGMGHVAGQVMCMPVGDEIHAFWSNAAPPPPSLPAPVSRRRSPTALRSKSSRTGIDQSARSDPPRSTAEMLVEQAAQRQIVKRRHQQAFRQVAAGAENDQRTGRRRVRPSGFRSYREAVW